MCLLLPFIKDHLCHFLESIVAIFTVICAEEAYHLSIKKGARWWIQGCLLYIVLCYVLPSADAIVYQNAR